MKNKWSFCWRPQPSKREITEALVSMISRRSHKRAQEGSVRRGTSRWQRTGRSASYTTGRLTRFAVEARRARSRLVQERCANERRVSREVCVMKLTKRPKLLAEKSKARRRRPFCMQTTSRIARSILRHFRKGSQEQGREKSEALVSMISRRSHKRNKGTNMAPCVERGRWQFHHHH
jgi:hypothetical protein